LRSAEIWGRLVDKMVYDSRIHRSIDDERRKRLTASVVAKNKVRAALNPE
jgi:hypothetical protein